jgi:hypothetical protein
MSKINDGGPAFPHSGYEQYGMSLRDYFAAKAMAAFIAKDDNAFDSASKAAEWAYEQSDAMIKERDRQPT